jgi:hypothetical protein
MGSKFGLWQLRRYIDLRAFENRLLRRIFGPKRDEVTRGWKNLHNEELLNLYTSASSRRFKACVCECVIAKRTF